MKTAIFSIALILSFTSLNSQNLNKYKYVVVPESFGFLNAPDEYQLNALTKFLFEKNGFKATMKSEQKPSDLKANGCLALYADVKDDSNLFVTKLTVVLENCNGEVVYRSSEGSSRKKDFKRAHHDALRDAFNSFEEFNYKFQQDSDNIATETISSPKAEQEGEVAAQAPEENMIAAMAEEQEDEDIEVKKTETGTEKSAVVYILDNAVYFIEKSDSGYSLFQKGMAEPFASLIKSKGQENYIYSSITKQGLAYFDKEENLVVEHFDKNKNEMIKTVYEVQD
ncbi:hypothetical protein RM549_02655 [Salegentibacter sp. F188]|uniref:Uncharacterized protein n=1 Tax=Autumnicola patrickiae TaxID=3075591 RepID=A0ABU3DYA0_9FLAO|nr:hypothetical protein [Salegentibacter sp. F188]MDT0688667.1 hypothetical protein [Salegentibacter sp. F188]